MEKKQGEWFGEYEIAIIVRCNSVQLHGNRKLLLVKLRGEEGWKWIERRAEEDRRSWMKTSNSERGEGISDSVRVAG